MVFLIYFNAYRLCGKNWPFGAPPKSERTSFGPVFFFGRNGSFGGLGPNFETWVLGNGPVFLVWAPLWEVQKHEILKTRKISRNTQRIDPKCIHGYLRNCFLPEEQCTSQTCISSFKKMGPLIFRQCFSCICGTFKKKIGSGNPFQVFWEVKNGPRGPFEDQGPISGRHVLSVSVVLSVEAAMECHARDNDVFCAVSLRGTTAASTSTVAGPARS